MLCVCDIPQRMISTAEWLERTGMFQIKVGQWEKRHFNQRATRLSQMRTLKDLEVMHI
jgi:hypothetical protein